MASEFVIVPNTVTAPQTSVPWNWVGSDRVCGLGKNVSQAGFATRPGSLHAG